MPFVSFVLSPTAGTETADQEGTFCVPASSVPVASTATWTADIRLRQDPDDPSGISLFLLANDGAEAWVYVSTGATDAIPKFLAHVYLSPAALGGPPAAPLYADVSFRLIDPPLAAPAYVAPVRSTPAAPPTS